MSGKSAGGCRQFLSASIVLALGGSLAIDCFARTAEARASDVTSWRGESDSLRLVTSCDDDLAPGTLRSEIGSAANGTTIDLTTLQCSTITLDPGLGEIDIQVPVISIMASPGRTTTIDAGGNSRIFNHEAFQGQLALYGLNIVNGKYASGAGGAIFGGCIRTNFGSLIIENSTISNCSLVATGDLQAHGGAIGGAEQVTLIGSTISGSRVRNSTGSFADSSGGGIAAGSFTAVYSTISGCFVAANNAAGGGVAVDHDFAIYGSALIGNSSDWLGGAILASNVPGNSGLIIATTISGNKAEHSAGGVSLGNSGLVIRNSTIAFNQTGGSGGGIVVSDNANLVLESSIVADNVGWLGADDMYFIGAAGLAGASAKNLIVASNAPLPADTVMDCPLLNPLALNGGLTANHLPEHDSPAIDVGSNSIHSLFDQRDLARVVGAGADIGSVERQPFDVDERIFAAGFDALCDQ